MRRKQDMLPLEMEVNALRQKLKSSNNATVEECERLRSEIQQLYFQLARTTRPGRYASRKKLKRNKREGKPIKPEVIPPDLDLSEYLNYKKEMSATKTSEETASTTEPYPSTKESNIYKGNSLPTGTLIPYKSQIKIQPCSYSISHDNEFISGDRTQTINERFALVAKRMQERRQKWQEIQQKKTPWWKRIKG